MIVSHLLKLISAVDVPFSRHSGKPSGRLQVPQPCLLLLWLQMCFTSCDKNLHQIVPHILIIGPIGFLFAASVSSVTPLLWIVAMRFPSAGTPRAFGGAERWTAKVSNQIFNWPDCFRLGFVRMSQPLKPCKLSRTRTIGCSNSQPNRLYLNLLVHILINTRFKQNDAMNFHCVRQHGLCQRDFLTSGLRSS